MSERDTWSLTLNIYKYKKLLITHPHTHTSWRPLTECAVEHQHTWSSQDEWKREHVSTSFNKVLKQGEVSCSSIASLTSGTHNKTSHPGSGARVYSRMLLLWVKKKGCLPGNEKLNSD